MKITKEKLIKFVMTIIIFVLLVVAAYIIIDRLNYYKAQPAQSSELQNISVNLNLS